MTNNNRQLIVNRGFSLLEMVIYVAIMALIMVVVVNTIIVMIFSQKRIENLRTIEHSAAVAMERLTRELREASSIDLGQSILGSHPGKMVINVIDENNNPQTIEFYLEGQTFVIEESNIGTSSPLIDPGARVTNLIFYSPTASSSRAVRIEMSIEAGQGQFLKSETFYNAVLLRNSN